MPKKEEIRFDNGSSDPTRREHWVPPSRSQIFAVRPPQPQQRGLQPEYPYQYAKVTSCS